VAGDAAILVDPESVDAIADGLHRALTGTGVRDEAMWKGPAHAATYTWDRCAEETVAAYARILG
jgi:alpha-1,3-rhamnosyl/mannosyltransferase